MRATNFRWLTSCEDVDLSADTPGGFVKPLIASGTLHVGDVVEVDGDFTVGEAGVDSVVIGVVVGGTRTDMNIHQDDIDIGTLAAEADEIALVCILGTAKVVSSAAIAAGALLKAAANGTVATATVATDAGKILGVALEAAAGAAEEILALIHPR